MASRVTLEQRPKKPHRFQPGDPKPPGSGRKRGQANRHTKILREAVVLAAEAVGRDGKGKEGLVGYLRQLAEKKPDLFVPLLAKVLPMQLHLNESPPANPKQPLTLEEMAARLEAKGLPTGFVTVLGTTHPARSNGHAHAPPSIVELNAARAVKH